jgi:CspA family cold shock protein
MHTGTVKIWIDEKGFGFIDPDVNADPDMFVHVSQVQRIGYLMLEVGQVLRYNIGTNPKSGREMAIDLELVDPIISIPIRPNLVEEDRRAIASAAFMHADGD